MARMGFESVTSDLWVTRPVLYQLYIPVYKVGAGGASQTPKYLA